jgi:hypothetical protein
VLAVSGGERGSPSGSPESRIERVSATSVCLLGYCAKLGEHSEEASVRGCGKLAADAHRALRACSKMGDSERAVAGDR